MEQGEGAERLGEPKSLIWTACTSRCLAFFPQEADLVFSPYSYLVDPVIRRALDIGEAKGM